MEMENTWVLKHSQVNINLKIVNKKEITVLADMLSVYL